MRIKLTFERTATVKETGEIEVDINGTTSVADVYKKAFKKDFKSFVITDREYKDEDWEFAIVRRDEPEEPDHSS